MEEHLLEEINYENVAKHVHTSSYEFHRAFSFLTGITANAYIRNRRLSLAGQEIVNSNVRITDVALKYGYDTPESFTKAFTRFHGVAPSVAREGNNKLVLFNPLVIKLTVDGGKTMEYKIVQTEAKKFIALVRSFKTEIINDEANHEVADFWAECNANQMLSPIWMLREDGKRDLYGLCSLLNTVSVSLLIKIRPSMMRKNLKKPVFASGTLILVLTWFLSAREIMETA